MQRWRGAALVVIAAVLVLGSAVTAIAAVARLQSGAGPAAVVHRYFAALARADAATALGLSERPVTGPYLSVGVLRQQRSLAPISHVHVQSVRAADGGRRVSVSYRLGFAEGPLLSTDTIALVAHGHSWRLAQVASDVRLISSQPGWLTLAGVALPRTALLFPGALPIASEWAGLSVTNRPSVLLRAGTVPISTAVNPGGQALASAGLRAGLTTCLRSPTPRCPLPSGVRAIPGSLRGEVRELSRPEVVLETGGVLHLQATATVHAAYAVWDFNNLAQPRTATEQIALSAQASVADLDTMYWQQP